MWSLILNFIKNKLFSNVGVFFLIFIGIFSIFIFFNSNIILSKFGFETTTNLKAELTRTQEELKRLQNININLNKQIEELNKNKEKETATIVKYIEKKDINKEKSNFIIKKKEEKIQKIIKQISFLENNKDNKDNKDNENIEILKLQNSISEENITSLNNTFQAFFS